MHRIFWLTLACCASSCTSTSTTPQPPQKAGGPQQVQGTGVVTAGEQPGNLLIQPDDDRIEDYCLVKNEPGVVVGDRVRFAGARYAALMLKGEHCLRLDLTALEKL